MKFPECPRKRCFNYLHTNGCCHLRSSNTLSESVFPLLKTFLELLFWNALQHGRRMSLIVSNVGPSKRFSVLGIAKSRAGPNREYGGWSNFNIDFLAQNSRTASAS
jgi:hypothetical protein